MVTLADHRRPALHDAPHPAAAPLPPLDPADSDRLDLFIACDLDIRALAERTGESFSRILAWTSSPLVRAYLDSFEEIERRSLRVRRDRALCIALDALEDLTTTSDDPVERRRAAASIVRLITHRAQSPAPRRSASEHAGDPSPQPTGGADKASARRDGITETSSSHASAVDGSPEPSPNASSPLPPKQQDSAPDTSTPRSDAPTQIPAPVDFPDPVWRVEETLGAVIVALMHNDRPAPDSGLLTLREFLSSDARIDGRDVPDRAADRDAFLDFARSTSVARVRNHTRFVPAEEPFIAGDAARMVIDFTVAHRTVRITFRLERLPLPSSDTRGPAAPDPRPCWLITDIDSS